MSHELRRGRLLISEVTLARFSGGKKDYPIASEINSVRIPSRLFKSSKFYLHTRTMANVRTNPHKKKQKYLFVLGSSPSPTTKSAVAIVEALLGHDERPPDVRYISLAVKQNVVPRSGGRGPSSSGRDEDHDFLQR